MKFIVDNWMLILMACVSGGMLFAPMLKGASRSGSVSTSEAVRLMNREKAVVIDVSDPDEYAMGHVAGARSVPLATLNDAKGLPTNKALPLIVVCKSGARSSKAAALLKKQGYPNTHVLAGGLAAWRDAQLPVEA